METAYIKDEIERCESVEELKEKIFPMLTTQKEQWTVKINEIIDQAGYSKAKFAELCGVSRVSVNKWCKGAIPKNRETFLLIGMAANYTIEQMNQLLWRYGRYPGLYAKSLEDCVCMFVLQNDFGTNKIEKYYEILKKIKGNIQLNSKVAISNGGIDTEVFEEKLSDVRDEDMLQVFVRENVEQFGTVFNHFCANVKEYLISNYLSNPVEDYRSANNIYKLALTQGWSSSLIKCVYEINQGVWYPTRNKIISLGLHLEMFHDEVDNFLQLAHMEPLCAKNIFESVMIFIFDDAELQGIMDHNEDMENSLSASESDRRMDGLCRYANDVLKQLEIPEVSSFISELITDDEENE